MLPVIRTEKVGSDLIETYVEYVVFLQQVRWWELIQLFKGFIEGVVKAFASTFSGKKAMVDDLEILVDVEFIEKVTHLPT